MRRRRYLRDRAEAAAAAAAGGGEGLQRSRDWLYESYYCMSQQHPLIVFLLLIVMGACLALLAVFFALGLVSGLPVAPWGPRWRPCPAPGCSSPRYVLPEAGVARARAVGRGKVSLEGFAQNKVARACSRWTGRACGFSISAPRGQLGAFTQRRCPQQAEAILRLPGRDCCLPSRSVEWPPALFEFGLGII